MRNIFKVTAHIPEAGKFEIFFDDKDRAEMFLATTNGMLNDEGKDKVKFDCEVVSMIDSDEDIINGFISAWAELN